MTPTNKDKAPRTGGLPSAWGSLALSLSWSSNCCWGKEWVPQSSVRSCIFFLKPWREMLQPPPRTILFGPIQIALPWLRSYSRWIWVRVWHHLCSGTYKDISDPSLEHDNMMLLCVDWLVILGTIFQDLLLPRITFSILQILWLFGLVSILKTQGKAPGTTPRFLIIGWQQSLIHARTRFLLGTQIVDHRRLELEKTLKKICKCPSFPATEVYLKSHSYLIAGPGNTIVDSIASMCQTLF